MLESNDDVTRCNTIYLATSEDVNLVKVGIWSGDIYSLVSRYFTYYGKNLNILTFKTDSSKLLLEQVFKENFKEFCVSSELFRKEFISKYVDYLTIQTSVSPVSSNYCETRKIRGKNVNKVVHEIVINGELFRLMDKLWKSLRLMSDCDTSTMIDDDDIKCIYLDKTLNDKITNLSSKLPKTMYKKCSNKGGKKETIRMISALFYCWNNHCLIYTSSRKRCGGGRKQRVYTCHLSKCE